MVEASKASGSLGPLSSLRWWRMTLKELREILRDRRTIMTLVGMPLLIYPLLGITFQKLLVTQAAAKSKIEYRVAFGTQRDLRVFRRLFSQSMALEDHDENHQEAQHEAKGTIDDPIWVLVQSGDQNATVDVDAFVSDRSADVGVRVKDGPRGGPYEIELSYRAGSPYSMDARRAIEERFRAVNQFILEKRLREIDSSFTNPVTILQKSITSTDGGGTSFSMATLIPLILILMTVTGAVYPAIDLTAGERERGTLEALISAPVPRHELLFAKYLAVLAVAMLTAIANLSSMVITAYSNGMEQLLFGTGGINFRMLGLMLGLLIVFAGFFAAVILILTSFARSFKEAQAYLIPVMLVSLAPGVLCLMPGIEMTAWMSVTPLVNIVILARDVVDGRAHAIWVILTLLSTALYAIAALALAARIFGTDAVLYGSEGSWRDLVRRPSIRQRAATLSQSIAFLAILFPSFLILSGLPRRLAGDWLAGGILGNAVLTILLFAVLPILFAKWSAIDLETGFQLKRSTVVSYAAAIIFGLSLWPFAIEMAQYQTTSLEQSDAIKELYDRVSASLNAIPLWMKILALAIVPAVCEELFFRGYLMTSFRTQMSTALAIVLSACLFGLFHVIATLSFERFVPTCFLGLALGWICGRTGSVFPGMLMHITHNSLILLMQTYAKELAEWGIGGESTLHIPVPWLVVAASAVVVAAGMIISGTRQRDRRLQPSVDPA